MLSGAFLFAARAERLTILRQYLTSAYIEPFTFSGIDFEIPAGYICGLVGQNMESIFHGDLTCCGI